MAPSAAPVSVPNKFRQYTASPLPGHPTAPAAPPPRIATPPQRSASLTPRPMAVAAPRAIPSAEPTRYVMRLRGAEVAHDLEVNWETTRLQARSKATRILKALEQRGYTIRKTHDADEQPVQAGLPIVAAFLAEPPIGQPTRWIEIEAHTVADILAFGLATEEEVPLSTRAQRVG